jgi:hypothetical protein
MQAHADARNPHSCPALNTWQQTKIPSLHLVHTNSCIYTLSLLYTEPFNVAGASFFDTCRHMKLHTLLLKMKTHTDTRAQLWIPADAAHRYTHSQTTIQMHSELLMLANVCSYVLGPRCAATFACRYTLSPYWVQKHDQLLIQANTRRLMLCSFDTCRKMQMHA